LSDQVQKVFRRIIAIGALLVAGAPIAHADVSHIDNDALTSLVAQGVPVIDIRTPEEWQHTGVIEGSHTLMFFDRRNQFDLDAWMARFKEIVPDENAPFVLICAAGVRSAAVSRVLDQRLKYSGVSNVARGIDHYIKHGGAVVPYPK